MKAELMIGKRRIKLEDQGESKNYKKYGCGKWGSENGDSDIVVKVHVNKDLLAEIEEESNG